MTGRHVRHRGRVGLTAADVDEFGWPTSDGTLRVTYAVHDSLPGAELEVDLGLVTYLEARLVEAMADGIRKGVYLTVVGHPAVARAYDQAVSEMAGRVRA